jgi:hypothetical protein
MGASVARGLAGDLTASATGGVVVMSGGVTVMSGACAMGRCIGGDRLDGKHRDQSPDGRECRDPSHACS